MHAVGATPDRLAQLGPFPRCVPSDLQAPRQCTGCRRLRGSQCQGSIGRKTQGCPFNASPSSRVSVKSRAPTTVGKLQGLDTQDFVARYGAYVDASDASVFVGAGLSMRAGYPGWGELCAPFLAQLDLSELADLPQVVQYFQDNVPGGRERVEGYLRETIASVPRLSADSAELRAHRLLADLPIRSVWTTNYDSLLEEMLNDGSPVERDDTLAKAPPPGSRLILKMHGSIHRGDSGFQVPLVIARDDYERYSTTNPRFWQLLQAEFLTKSFLFLGFSFTDPNLERTELAPCRQTRAGCPGLAAGIPWFGVPAGTCGGP